MEEFRNPHKEGSESYRIWQEGWDAAVAKKQVTDNPYIDWEYNPIWDAGYHMFHSYESYYGNQDNNQGFFRQ